MVMPSSIATATRSRPSSAAPCDDIAACRTAALGGHVEECDRVRASARSPTTRAATATAPSARPPPRREWMEAREAELLARRIFSCRLHAPGGARSDRLAEPAGGLRPSVPGRRRDLAADRRRSRSTSGPRSASWPSSTPGARTSQHHPHVHCVVPGGGLVARRLALGRLPAGVLPAGPRPQPRLPGQVPRAAPQPPSIGESSPSTGSSPRWRTRASSNAGSPPAPRPSGSCTPSRPSAGRSRC